jgi:hypothetical protein
MVSLPLAMSFRGRARLFAIVAWIGAWALQMAAVMLVTTIPDTWRFQNALMPLFVLIPVAIAVRLSPAQDWHSDASKQNEQKEWAFHG